MKLSLLIIVITFSVTACATATADVESLTQSMEEAALTDEIVIESQTTGVGENDYEELSLEEWDTASYNFYSAYQSEPTEFEDYDDYYYILCYMLINHLEYYEYTIENPDYDEDEVHEILTEMAGAYDDAALFLNTYTDFWSSFTAACQQVSDSQGEILSYTYTFTLAQKDGLEDEQVEEEQDLAEEACFELVETMFAEGTLDCGMSSKERAYVLYQWVCSNVDYAYDAPTTDSDDAKPDNCYSAMIEGCAVCQGITGAYVQLCRLAGVEMYVQLGYTSEGAHSWCKIMDEETGEWMYIDPTWGITGYSGDQGYTDKWFWVTREYMEEYSNDPRTFTE